MELTLQLKLLPTDDQASALRATMERFNEACTWLAQQAFAQQITNKLALQRLYYHGLRSRFALPSQMAVRCLARPVDLPYLSPRGGDALRSADHALSWPGPGQFIDPVRSGASVVPGWSLPLEALQRS